MLLLVVAVVVAAGILYSIGSWHEPSYRGIRLREWLVGYEVPSQFGQTDEAVREMGESCVPYLIELMNASDSPMGQAFAYLADGLGFGNMHVHMHYVPAEQKRRWAEAAFRSLGPAAKAAVPDLARLLHRAETQKAAGGALSAIGAPSMPALTAALSDSQKDVRIAAATALGECVTPERSVFVKLREPEETAAILLEAKKTWPALVQCLKDPDPEVRIAAAGALADFGVQPTETVNALIILLGDNDPEVRGIAAVSVGRLREAARPALPTLLNLLKDPGRRVSERAAFALRLIDTETAVQAGVK